MIFRRDFVLKGLYYVFGATTLTFFSGCSEKSVKYKNLKKLLLNEDFKDIFNGQVIRTYFMIKENTTIDQLIEKIFQKKIPKTITEILQQIHISTKQDFKSGEIVIIDGCLFSTTVVEFAALQHKLNRLFK